MAIDEISLDGSRVAFVPTRIRLLQTSPEATARLLAEGLPRTYRRNQVVFHRGDEGSSVHVVMSGRFAMEEEAPDGTALILGVLSPGEAFGDLTHLSGAPFRLATVVALEPGETIMVPGERFDAIRRDLPEINHALCAMLTERLQAAQRRIVELAQVPAPRRVITALARLANLYRSGTGPVTVPFSQQRLAGLAGTSRDTVNRVLARAEREGWLLVGRQKAVVLDLDELRRRGA